MVFQLAVFTNLLFAFLALAAPSAEPSRENRVESRATFTGMDSTHLAGAYLTEAPGTFDTVSGIFVVPYANTTGSAFFSIGIDGFSCSAVLQSGVGLTVSSGRISYTGFARWYPAVGSAFNLVLNPGNWVRASVIAHSSTTGVAILENLSTGEIATQQLSGQALCQQNAEWVVQDWNPLNPSSTLPLANFQRITFTEATALGTGGIYTPANSTTMEISQDGTVLTSTTADVEFVTIDYTG